MQVILFDIDGTLLKTGGAGWAAFCAAFAEQFDVADVNGVACAGRTDRGIVSELFRMHAIDDSPAAWQQFRRAYLRHLEHFLPLRQGAVMAGVASLVRCLAQRGDLALGLLTGNARGGAELKLRHYGLIDYFPFGSFGDRHRQRADVAREALAAARQRVGRSLEPRQIWIIGDTPLDVRCARSIGARAVAVASGDFSLGELARERPDVALDDLTDTHGVARLLSRAGDR